MEAIKNKITIEQAEAVRALGNQLNEANHQWRPGQAFFNALYQLYPETADEIRGTSNDTFYDRSLIHDCINTITGQEILAYPERGILLTRRDK